MKNISIRLLIILIPMVFFAFFGMGYQYEREIKQSFDLSEEGTLRLKLTKGDIEVSTHGSQDVKVEAILFSDDRSQLNKTQIESEINEKTLFIYTPEALSLKVNIDLYLKVPENLNTIQISTLSGDIKIRGSNGKLILTTVNGNIDVGGTMGNGVFKSTNGNIDVYFKDQLSGDVSATSTNGSIKVVLNEDSDFSVKGKTISGNIQSDFNVGIGNDFGIHQIRGSINKGTFQINIASVNGNISLSCR